MLVKMRFPHRGLDIVRLSHNQFSVDEEYNEPESKSILFVQICERMLLLRKNASSTEMDRNSATEKQLEEIKPARFGHLDAQKCGQTIIWASERLSPEIWIAATQWATNNALRCRRGRRD